MDDDFLSRNFTLFLSLFSVTCSGSNVGTGVYVNLHSYLEGHNLKSKSQKQVLKNLYLLVKVVDIFCMYVFLMPLHNLFFSAVIYRGKRSVN